jgi:hypothetical protein
VERVDEAAVATLAVEARDASTTDVATTVPVTN